MRAEVKNKIRVKVKFFSRLREETGRGEDEVSVEGSTIGDLLALLEILLGMGDLEERVSKGLVLIARNHEYSTVDADIEEGDEIAFFPPVSGG
jgi:molybdopterin synthase sulfur carrier subunit